MCYWVMAHWGYHSESMLKKYIFRLDWNMEYLEMLFQMFSEECIFQE